MNYSGLIKFDTGNSHGISTTLFVSGCSNKCKGCHKHGTISMGKNLQKKYYLIL